MDTTPPSLPIVSGDIENVGQSTAAYFKRHPWYLISPVVIAAILWFIVGLFQIPTSDNWIYELIGGALLAAYAFIYLTVANLVQAEFMQQFAAANGYAFSAKGTMAGLDGTLFQLGHTPGVRNVVSGQFSSNPIRLFSYNYTVGYGKHSRTYRYSIFMLQFDTVMPDILLEAKGYDFGGESLFEKLSGKNLVKLEGDFNNYFSLGVPKGCETDALEIFTPDVMQVLIEKAKTLSLEITGDHLFIYRTGIITTKTDLYALYGLAQIFAEKIGPVLARMKSSMVAELQEPTA